MTEEEELEQMNKIAGNLATTSTEEPVESEPEKEEEAEKTPEQEDEKEEEKQEGEQDEDDEDLKDIVPVSSPFTKTTEAAKPTVKEEDKTPALLEELEVANQKIKSYEELFSDPQLAWAINAVKEGKNLTEAIQEVLPVDVSKYTIDDLFEISLREAKESYNFTDEQMEEERERFNGLTALQKANEVRPIRETLVKANEAKKGLISADASKHKPNPEEQIEIRKKSQQLYFDGVTEQVTSLKGKEFLGLEINDARVKQVFDYISTNPIEMFIQTPDGEFIPNPEVVAELSCYRALTSRAMSKLVKTVSTDTKIKEIRERLNIKDPKEKSGTKSIASNQSEQMKKDLVEGFNNRIV